MVELDGKDAEAFVEHHTGKKMNTRPRIRSKSRSKLLMILLVLAGISAIAAVFFLVAPIINSGLRSFGLHIRGAEQLIQWLGAGGRGLSIAVTFGLLSALFLILARFRYQRDGSVYIEAGCPQCYEHDLMRIRRWRRDRILAFASVPVRRYACRNCTWQGVRLVENTPKHHVEKQNNKAAEIGDGLMQKDVESVLEVEVAAASDAPVLIQEETV